MADADVNTDADTTKQNFYSELRDLINKYSKENGSDTPDFVLSAFLGTVLAAFDSAVRARDVHVGVKILREGLVHRGVREMRKDYEREKEKDGV